MPYCFRFARNSGGKCTLQYKLFSSSGYFWIPAPATSANLTLAVPDHPNVGGFEGFIRALSGNQGIVASNLRNTFRDMEVEATDTFMSDFPETSSTEAENSASDIVPRGTLCLLTRAAEELVGMPEVIDPRGSVPNLYSNILSIARRVIGDVKNGRFAQSQGAEYSNFALSLNATEIQFWTSLSTQQGINQYIDWLLGSADVWMPLCPASDVCRSEDASARHNSITY